MHLSTGRRMFIALIEITTMIDSGIKQACKDATKPQSSYTFSSCSWLEIMDRFSDKNKAQRSMENYFPQEEV